MSSLSSKFPTKNDCVLQCLPKFFGTAARTYLVDGAHWAGLVHSQKRALANQRCVHLLLRVRSSP